jgi:hypothetical protein
MHYIIQQTRRQPSIFERDGIIANNTRCLYKLAAQQEENDEGEKNV